MTALPKQRLSEKDYLAIERAAEFKSEYIDGEMYAMSGARLPHLTIVGNLSGALHGQFKGRPCRAYTNDFRVRVGDSGLYTYPDLVALCGEPQLLDHHFDTLLNPQLIVEVLSPTTENYDRGEKFRRYRQLDSLVDYLLIAQEKMSVEHWSRHEADLWRVHDFQQSTDRVHIPSVEAELLLSDIYDGVEFP